MIHVPIELNDLIPGEFTGLLVGIHTSPSTVVCRPGICIMIQKKEESFFLKGVGGVLNQS